MRKALFIACAFAGMAASSGCMSVYSPAIGILFTEVRGPVTAEESTIGAKEGKACAQSILGLVAQGDASIKAAAAAGGITHVTTVDTYSRNMLGVIGDFCTVVRGN